MEAATGMQMSDGTTNGETGAKAAPDWLKKHNGEMRRANEQQVDGENFVELKYRSLENVATAKLAKGLGVFSIALGLAEMLAPAQVGGMIGVSNRFRTFLPALGAREIAHGIGILSNAKPTTAVWTRVGGDVVDLAYLGAAFAAKETNKRRLVGATVAVLGVGILDMLCAQRLAAKPWSESDGNPMAPTTVGQPSARRAMSA
jgi:hypothetical protein